MAKPSGKGKGGNDGGDGTTDSGGGKLRGTNGNDVFTSTSGNELFQGREGTDTLILNGSVWDYDWNVELHERGVDWTILDTTGADGEDSLSSVEILQFDDATIVLGQDTPMEIIADAPERFVVYEDETDSFNLIIQDLDDTDVDVKFETGLWSQDRDYADLTILQNLDSDHNRYGAHSVQRVYEFTYDYVEGDVSLAEGEEYVQTVTLMATTTSSEDFFGYTEEETRAITFDLVIIGQNDAPTIGSWASFRTDRVGGDVFDLSSLGDDIDSDDDGTTLNYEVVSVTQNYAYRSFPLEFTTVGTNLVLSGEQLPLGMTTDEEAWAVVEVQAVDRHGAVSATTADIDVYVSGTATERVRTSILDENEDIDLSSVTFAPEDILDYGTEILDTLVVNPYSVQPLWQFTLGDDARYISAGSINQFIFFTDSNSSIFGAGTVTEGNGADTLIFDLQGTVQQSFAMNSIETGYGEDVVVVDSTGAQESLLLGPFIDTGAQSDQVIIRQDASVLAWHLPMVETGSGHDVVDIEFVWNGTDDYSQLVFAPDVYLGTGNDTFRFVATSSTGHAPGYDLSFRVDAEGGDDYLVVDTSGLPAGAPIPDGLDEAFDIYYEQYPGGAGGYISLGAGSDTLELALSDPFYGERTLVVNGNYSSEDGADWDHVILTEWTQADLDINMFIDDYGRTGFRLSTDGGQHVELIGIQQVTFADGTDWVL